MRPGPTSLPLLSAGPGQAAGGCGTSRLWPGSGARAGARVGHHRGCAAARHCAVHPAGWLLCGDGVLTCRCPALRCTTSCRLFMSAGGFFLQQATYSISSLWYKITMKGALLLNSDITSQASAAAAEEAAAAAVAHQQVAASPTTAPATLPLASTAAAAIAELQQPSLAPEPPVAQAAAITSLPSPTSSAATSEKPPTSSYAPPPPLPPHEEQPIAASAPSSDVPSPLVPPSAAGGLSSVQEGATGAPAAAAAGAASTDDGMAKWRGRVALVTGSSSGIGSAVSVVPSVKGGWGDPSARSVCAVL